MVHLTVYRSTLVVALLALSWACNNGERPAAPTPVTATSSPQAPVPPPAFPPLSRPARVYAFDQELSYPVAWYTRESRYVLYEDGAFELQYLHVDYTGKYSESNSTIGFQFAGGGDASGSLSGDVLAIRYSEWMQLSDFENAVYKRTEPAAPAAKTDEDKNARHR
jgi:hypothetical protein